jgi:hypothetical protein
MQKLFGDVGIPEFSEVAQPDASFPPNSFSVTGQVALHPLHANAATLRTYRRC